MQRVVHDCGEDGGPGTDQRPDISMIRCFDPSHRRFFQSGIMWWPNLNNYLGVCIA